MWTLPVQEPAKGKQKEEPVLSFAEKLLSDPWELQLYPYKLSRNSRNYEAGLYASKATAERLSYEDELTMQALKMSLLADPFKLEARRDLRLWCVLYMMRGCLFL